LQNNSDQKQHKDTYSYNIGGQQIGTEWP